MRSLQAGVAKCFGEEKTAFREDDLSLSPLPSLLDPNETSAEKGEEGRHAEKIQPPAECCEQ